MARSIQSGLLFLKISKKVFLQFNRWVIKYARELEATFSKKFRKYDAYVSWKMDETYLKHKGKDVYS